MLMVLMSLALGVGLGFFLWRNSKGIIQKANFITLSGLFFLLLVMGAQLGSNQKVLSGLLNTGKQAFVIALLSIAGSVILVQLASGYIKKSLTTTCKEEGYKAGDMR